MKDDNAFPAMEKFERFNDDTGRYEEHHLTVGGLTKREYIAIRFYEAILSNPNMTYNHGEVFVATAANTVIGIADTFIAALSNKGGQE